MLIKPSFSRSFSQKCSGTSSTLGYQANFQSSPLNRIWLSLPSCFGTYQQRLSIVPDMQSGEIFIKILHFHLVVSFLYTLVDTGILFRLSFLQLLTHLENIEFQVVGFLRRPEDRMIRRLCFKFHLTQSLMRSVGCFADGLCEQLRIHKVGTGAGH